MLNSVIKLPDEKPEGMIHADSAPTWDLFHGDSAKQKPRDDVCGWWFFGGLGVTELGKLL